MLTIRCAQDAQINEQPTQENQENTNGMNNIRHKTSKNPNISELHNVLQNIYTDENYLETLLTPEV